MNRRTFTGLALSALAGTCLKNPLLAMVQGGTAVEEPDDLRLWFSGLWKSGRSTEARSHLLSWQATAGKLFALPASIHGHSAVVDPSDAHRILLLPKVENRASIFEIDDWSGQSTPTFRERTFESHTDCVFYGHGHADHDRKIWIDVEAKGDPARNEAHGFFVIRDLKTQKILDVHPTHGRLPHEFKIDAQRNLIYLVQRGIPDRQMPSQLSIFDYKTFQCLEHYELVPEDRGLMMEHLTLAEDKVYVSCAKGPTSLGGVVTFTPDRKSLKRLNVQNEWQKSYDGLHLSLAYSAATKKLFSTNVSGRHVFVWSTETDECIDRIQMPSPAGIFCDDRSQNVYIVSSYHNPSGFMRASLSDLSVTDLIGRSHDQIRANTFAHMTGVY